MNRFKLISLYFASFASGFLLILNFVLTQSRLIANLDPIYVMYANVGGAIGFSILISMIKVRRTKFVTTFAIIILLLAIGLLLSHHYDEGHYLIMLFIFTIFGLLFFSWGFNELINRNFNPANYLRVSTYYSTLFELGSIGACFTIMNLYHDEDLLAFYQLTPILLMFVAVCLFLGFHGKRNFEIQRVINHKKKINIWALILILGIVGSMFSINSFMGDYMLAIILKNMFSDSQDIANLMTKILILNSVLRIFFSNFIGKLLSDFHLSPIILTFLGIMTPALIAVISFFHSGHIIYFVLFIACVISTDNFFWQSFNAIANFFSVVTREQFKRTIFFNFYLLTGTLVAIGFGFLSRFSNDSIIEIMICIFIVTGLLASFLLVYFRAKLTQYFFQKLQVKDQIEQELAIFALSFLKPKSIVKIMIKMLQVNTNHYIKAKVVDALSVMHNFTPLEYEQILSEYDKGHEDVQIAILKFITCTHNVHGSQYALGILHGIHKAHSFKVKIEATRTIAKLFHENAIPLLLEDLKSEDERVIANAIERIGEFKNKDIIPDLLDFTKSNVPRIRANSLLALRYFSTTIDIYRKGVKEMLNSQDIRFVASAIYVVGQGCDKYFLPELLYLYQSKLDDPMIKRGLAFAFFRMKDRRGYELFYELFVSPYVAGKQQEFLHFFSILNEKDRFDLLEAILSKKLSLKENIDDIIHHLKNSYVDFSDELNFIYSLKE